MNNLGRRGGCTMQLLPFFLLLLAFTSPWWPAGLQFIEPAYAMGDNLIGQLMDQAQQWISDKWDAVFDPIYWWYFLLFVGLVVAGIIATFVPFKIVRLTLGIALALGLAFVLGGRHMGLSQKAKVEKLRQQLRDEKARKSADSGGGRWLW